MFDNLIGIKGHLSSAIFSIEGHVFNQEATHDKYSFDNLSEYILPIIKASVLSVNNAKLGKCDFIQLGHDEGLLIIMRSGAENIIISSLFEDESLVASIKQGMLKDLDMFFKKAENHELLALVDKKPDIVARYVNSSDHAAHQMLKFANIQPMDVLYDLGCGNASVLLYAANTFSVEKSVGVECRDHVVALAKKRILKNNLEKRIEIVESDLFDINLEPANVIFIYLSRKSGKKLTQLFLKSLKKGSRIVSQTFPLRYMEPDDIYQDSYCKLYLYTIK